MKKLLSYVMIAFFAATGLSLAQDSDAMMAKEKAAWQAFKDKDADGFKKIASADMIGVYREGISDMAKEMADMQKWDMKSFEISDYKTTSAGPNLVISTYVVKLDGTYDGKDASGTYNAGTVWHRKGGSGDWHAVFHTNVAQAGVETSAQKKE